MNELASPLSRNLDSIDGYTKNVYASSATWLKVVDFYNNVLPSSSMQAGPPVAIFQLAEGADLHVIQTNDPKILAEQATQTIWHLPLGESKLVTQAFEYAIDLDAKPVLYPTLVWALPLPAKDGYQALITMGIVRFCAHQQFTSEDTTVGVIHNPNW